MIKLSLGDKMQIKLKNTRNTRTLSDLINRDGLHIKNNLLIRSDALNKITAEDISILKNEYSLKRIIDLRCDNETKNNPDAFIEGVELFLNPVLPSQRVGVTKKGNDDEDFKDFVMAIHKNGALSSVEFMSKVYKEIVTTDFSNNAYEKFLKLLLNPKNGATLWHCSAGKDRAGFATILILYILDFDLDTIVKDYLSTNLYYEANVNALALEYGEEYREVLETVFGVNKEYINVIFDNINNTYGSFDNYLKEGLEFSEADKEKLKSIYLEV